MNDAEENWINVKGFEGVYLISDLGRVKRLAYILKNGKIKKENVLKNSLNGNRYVQLSLTYKEKKLKTSLHQLMAINFLNHTPDGHKKVIDHVNNIPYDNRLCNLQVISHRENMTKDKIGKGTSKFVGVYFSNRAKKWVSEIRYNGKKYHLGTFIEEESAAKAYIKRLNSLKHKRKK